ncbi:ABC transporter permease [SAR202 cluster bacterium AC-647-N09_OGT_505m]|nr:ABC transporter permease [SAR202 cluster bacterium AC-647-N09_OGT_505m]
MQRYILRRLALGALTAWLVSLLIFAILRIAPGDVALMILSEEEDAIYSQEMVDNLREELGLNRSLPEQYVVWLSDWVTLDWGTSLFNDHEVFDVFMEKLPVTLELSIVTVTISTILGIPVGVIMALKQDSWIDYVLRIWALAGLSMPSFWTATLLLVGGVYFLNWRPPIGYVSIVEDPARNLNQYLWPSLILGYATMATKARMMRSTMLEVLRQDYIRTAHAKGLRFVVVVNRHALKNALIPVVTIIGVSIALIMGGSVIMERIFTLPGIGNFLVSGMQQRDYPVVQSLIMFFAMWIVFVNLVVDLTYGWLDPRIRFD